LLGLDVQVGIILLLAGLDSLGTLRRLIAAWRAAQPRRAHRSSVADRPSAATDDEAWAPDPLSPIGGAAA
jgi:hypothetical protein